jgi:hypothetical protein
MHAPGFIHPTKRYLLQVLIRAVFLKMPKTYCIGLNLLLAFYRKRKQNISRHGQCPAEK